MNDKQRIKLIRLVDKFSPPNRDIVLYHKFDFDRFKNNPICYGVQFSLEGGKGEAFIGCVFGEFLRVKFGYQIWDSILKNSGPCPEKFIIATDHALLRKAGSALLGSLNTRNVIVGVDALTTSVTDKEVADRLELEKLLKEIGEQNRIPD